MRKPLFRSRGKSTEEKITELQMERENCKEHIRMQRDELKEIKEQMQQADELDNKILELDYWAKKEEMDAELQHFHDLSDLIARLQNIQHIDATRKELDYITKIDDCIDAREMRRQKDELEIRRQILKEESEY